MNALDPANFKDVFSYDPQTGRLYWKARGQEAFCDGGHSAAHKASKFNSAFAGKEAFTSSDHLGYRRGSLMGRCVKAHRVVWAYHYGAWPEAEIDHINGDPSDNRIENLRAATRSQNLMNMRSRAGSSSKFRGVSWHAQRGKWAARIRVGGKYTHLGLFDSEEAAAAAYNAAASSSHDAEFRKINDVRAA